MIPAVSVPAQHDHVITFATTTGVGWLWVVVLAGVLVAAAGTVLLPVVPDQMRPVLPVVSGSAMGMALLVLLLAPGLVLPQQVTGTLVLVAGVGLAATRHGTGDSVPRWVLLVRLLAPVLVVVAAVVVAVVLATAWWTPSGVDVGPLVFTGLFVGLVGLTWVAPAGPTPRPVAVAVHGGGWLLAHGVTGATALTAIAALPA